jgi:hypothetical protein
MPFSVTLVNSIPVFVPLTNLFSVLTPTVPSFPNKPTPNPPNALIVGPAARLQSQPSNVLTIFLIP